MERYAGGVVDLTLIGTLDGTIELLDGIVIALCDAIEGQQANGYEKEYSFHGDVLFRLERQGQA